MPSGGGSTKIKAAGKIILYPRSVHIDGIYRSYTACESIKEHGGEIMIRGKHFAMMLGMTLAAAAVTAQAEAAANMSREIMAAAASAKEQTTESAQRILNGFAKVAVNEANSKTKTPAEIILPVLRYEKK